MFSPKFEQLTQALDRLKRSDMTDDRQRVLTDPTVFRSLPKGHQVFVNDIVQLARDNNLDGRGNDVEFKRDLVKALGYEITMGPYSGYSIDTPKGQIVF